MNSLVKINNKNLQVKELENQRVVTFKDIDFLHERVEGTAGRNFRENRKQFIDTVDYFEVTPKDFQSDEIRRLGIDSPRGGILITESGYLMLVKSLQDDLAWKVQRELVNNYFRVKAMDPYQGLSKELKAVFILDKKTQEMDNRLTKIENTMTIDYAQQEELNSLAKRVVVQALGGYGTPAYKELNKKAFSAMWKDYKRVMQVNSYKNTAVKDFDMAKDLINGWEPNRELELMIKGANSQIAFKEVM